MFSAALAIPGWRGQFGIAAQFALFGALHAAALVLSVRACAGMAAGRRLLFVALAALLALATARLGLFGLRALAGPAAHSARSPSSRSARAWGRSPTVR